MEPAHAKIVELRSHSNFRPDVASLARNQMATARTSKNMSHSEFAEVLANLLDWPVSAETVEAWETTAVPPGDALVAAGMVSHSAPVGTVEAPTADLVGQVISDKFADVTSIFASRSEFATHMSTHDLLDTASEVRAAGLSLNLLCQQYPMPKLAQRVSDGLSLSLLFLNPEGNAIKAREAEERYPQGHLAALTALNVQTMHRMAQELPDEARDRVQIRTYDETIRFNILLIDSKLCVMQPYLPEARGVDSPTFVIQRRWASAGLFSTYEQTFNSLWMRGAGL